MICDRCQKYTLSEQNMFKEHEKYIKSLPKEQQQFIREEQKQAILDRQINSSWRRTGSPMAKAKVKLKNNIIPNYKKGYFILVEYFDSISDEEKEKVLKKLEKIGL